MFTPWNGLPWKTVHNGLGNLRKFNKGNLKGNQKGLLKENLQGNNNGISVEDTDVDFPVCASSHRIHFMNACFDKPSVFSCAVSWKQVSGYWLTACMALAQTNEVVFLK